MASEVERVALQFENVELVKVDAKKNPISGQHVELIVQPLPQSNLDLSELKIFLNSHLPRHMVPKRITVSKVQIGHRYKKS
jgi:acyl-CoA synthetase (AMP-forming)/AMP-acid ligase II